MMDKEPTLDEVMAEIERLRAKLAEADRIIEPFAENHADPYMIPTTEQFRAAAEWMEKGDE